jgi:hypothetical protein
MLFASQSGFVRLVKPLYQNQYYWISISMAMTSGTGLLAELYSPHTVLQPNHIFNDTYH